MIIIHPSKTADTRTCDYATVTKEQLLESSKQHIGDVRKALGFFASQIYKAEAAHDTDKITDIDGFHKNFLTGFAERDWLDRHVKLNRHHLMDPEGIPADVNLIDVLDMIADCVMSGMGRSGSVYPLALSPDTLNKAFQNTITLLKEQVVVEP